MGKPQISTESYATIQIDDLMSYDGFNPRTELGDVSDLMELIRANGLINPPTVCSANDGTGTYWVVAGARRVEACRQLGFKSVPCVIRSDFDITKPAALAAAVAENLEDARQALPPIDLAKAYKRLCELVGGGDTRASCTAVAKLVGCSRDHVHRTLRLLDAPESLQEKLARGEITKRAVRTIMEVPDDIRQRVADRVEALSTGERTENAVRRITNDVSREEAAGQGAVTDLAGEQAAKPQRRVVSIMRSKREMNAAIDAALDSLANALKEDYVDEVVRFRSSAAALMWVMGEVDDLETHGRDFERALATRYKDLKKRRKAESEERAEKDA